MLYKTGENTGVLVKHSSRLFQGIEINHSGLSSAVVLSTTTTTYTADNFSPYELVVVSIRGVGGTAAGLYPVSMQNCRTAEARKFHSCIFYMFLDNSDGCVARASASGAADSSLIPSGVKPMTSKLIFKAFLLDAWH